MTITHQNTYPIKLKGYDLREGSRRYFTNLRHKKHEIEKVVWELSGGSLRADLFSGYMSITETGDKGKYHVVAKLTSGEELDYISAESTVAEIQLGLEKLFAEYSWDLIT